MHIFTPFGGISNIWQRLGFNDSGGGGGGIPHPRVKCPGRGTSDPRVTSPGGGDIWHKWETIDPSVRCPRGTPHPRVKCPGDI